MTPDLPSEVEMTIQQSVGQQQLDTLTALLNEAVDSYDGENGVSNNARHWSVRARAALNQKDQTDG